MRPIHIIGGGLAGSEAAWQAAELGVPVVLHEMRPNRSTAAHRTSHLAELVCSNSFRSDDASTNAVGILHREMRALGSIVLKNADACQVPAGGALAVDRDGFSHGVEAAILGHPLIARRARRDRRPAAGGLGQCHRRHRPAHLALAGRGDRPADAARARSPSSTRSRRSSIAIRSTWTWRGCSRATTRKDRAEAARRPTSIVR